MEQRKHWWNSRWGTFARHDIFLRVDGDRWHVEDRWGGADGSSKWSEHYGEDAALDRVRALMTGDGWREIGT